MIQPYHCSNQCGSILMITLIFFLILTTLILSAAETGLLEIKMSNYFYNKMLAEADAESALTVEESKLAGIMLTPPEMKSGIVTQVSEPSFDSCENADYLIDVQSTYQLAFVHLQSLFQVSPTVPPKSCENQPSSTHRLWWKILIG